MKQRIELFFDFRSPYSYLAFTQLLQIEAALVLRPMQVLKVMAQVGNTPTTLLCKPKGAYANIDLARWASRYGIALNPSDMMRNDGDGCARAVLAVGSPEDAVAVATILYRAIWSEGVALTGTQEIIAALSAAGLETDTIAARIDSQAVAALLAANSDEAAQRGVFGSPTMFVGDQMFFGNDRLDFLRAALLSSARAA
ncbi:2-hydroxychromene-2-carboxylate isomerase [Sandaracinobacteroides saxicola]|uniref:2-hydroxychromene-2-carboxylate isomerase n=1 Tax=Sandaracinobacteroides saxicola TaxID=2759707 RepID=A0A7G5IDZ1_9SPHN|nr:2-hydroxychromene-2-carboxylate isomerase [Sandaracinobacteroides saxicola]QMW21583.1 2-hydroxychromene-2-carboxylate isomerase [Sandaracinobacteroides saxicola]